MHYYIDVLKKYIVFSGRSRRAEFWFFTLFSMIISIILFIISNLSGDIHGYLGTVYSLLVLIPSAAVLARRLHDIGKNGWWLLLLLVPILGWIWLLILTVLDSNPGDNKYGPNPKGAFIPTPTSTPTSTPPTSA